MMSFNKYFLENCFRAMKCKILHVCTFLHSLRVMYIKMVSDISGWHGNCTSFPQTLEMFLDINWLRRVIHAYCSDVNFSYKLKTEIQWNSMNHLPIPSENILISSVLLSLSIFHQEHHHSLPQGFRKPFFLPITIMQHFILFLEDEFKILLA